MEIQEDICPKCLYPITNPVCTSCYFKQLKLWLKDQRIDPKTKNRVLNKIDSKLSDKLNENNSCVLCRNKPITECPYCFFLIALKVITEDNFSQEKVESFMETFNYQLGHEDYEEII